jgi:integrase
MPKRRANGEGECRFDAERNRWMARLPPDNYGRKGPRKSFLTQKEALKYLEKAKAEREAGIDHSKKDVAMSVVFETWIDAKRHSLAQRTYENHQSNIKILNGRIGKIKVKALTLLQIQNTFNKLLDEGRAISSIHGIKTTLNAALERAISWGLITVNPARDLELPSIPKTDIHVWDAEQIQAFLTVIEGHYLEMFFIVGMWLGLRRGELFNLRWQDVDLDARLLSVKGSAQRLVGKGMVRGKTKAHQVSARSR